MKNVLLKIITIIFICLFSIAPVFAAEDASFRDEEPAAQSETETTEEIPEEVLQGQPGYTMIPAAGVYSERFGSVTFVAHVPQEITETVVLTFIDNDTYREYYVELYKTGGYQYTASVPEGAYTITSGGPISDNIQLYMPVSEHDYFYVRDGESQVYDFTIVSKDTYTGRLYEKKDIDEEELGAPEQEEPETIRRDIRESRWFYVAMAVVFLIIAIAMLALFFKYDKITNLRD